MGTVELECCGIGMQGLRGLVWGSIGSANLQLKKLYPENKCMFSSGDTCVCLN